jgi:hypothetical protein
LFFFLNYFFKNRFAKLQKRIESFESIQKETLTKILEKNKGCTYLKNYNVYQLEDFERLPLVSYEDLESEIVNLLHSKEPTITNEKIIAFSKSSGTTSFSKIIPQSKKNISYNYQAGFDLLTSYLHHFPNSKITAGKNFSLTGSYDIQNGLIVGDISALIAFYLPSIFHFFRIPSKKIALIQNWDKKLEALIPKLIQSDIRWIAGVPSWIKVIIDRIEFETQKSILEIWPNLEVFFYGGTDIAIYKSKFDQIFQKKVVYWQTYNASEGFFAIQISSNSSDMALISDYGVYFEFLCVKSNQIVQYKNLKIGNQYELIITNSCGLWRYRIGDVIEITHKNPLKIKIVGRTKHFINAFGEELMIHNVEKALEILNQEMAFEIAHYSVAPKIDENDKGFHKWLIEFKMSPSDISIFEKKLDTILQSLNSDYKAKRTHDLVMKNLQIITAKNGQFEKWLRNQNRLSAQAKIPKLSNDTFIIDEILSNSQLRNNH